MTLICFASQKGSPGTTAAALAVAAALKVAPGRRKLLLEADSTGGTLAIRYRLPVEPGLLTLAAAVRGEIDVDGLWRHVQLLPGGLPVVVCPDGPEQVHAAMAASGGRLGRFLNSLRDVDVICDVGRLAPDSPALAFVAEASALLMVARPTAEQLQPAARRMNMLKPRVTNLGWVLIGEKPYGAADVEATYGFPVVGIIADDARSVASLEQGVMSKRLRRHPFVRSSVTMAKTLADWLAPISGAANRPEQQAAPAPPPPPTTAAGPSPTRNAVGSAITPEPVAPEPLAPEPVAPDPAAGTPPPPTSDPRPSAPATIVAGVTSAAGPAPADPAPPPPAGPSEQPVAAPPPQAAAPSPPALDAEPPPPPFAAGPSPIVDAPSLSERADGRPDDRGDEALRPPPAFRTRNPEDQPVIPHADGADRPPAGSRPADRPASQPTAPLESQWPPPIVTPPAAASAPGFDFSDEPAGDDEWDAGRFTVTADLNEVFKRPAGAEEPAVDHGVDKILDRRPPMPPMPPPPAAADSTLQPGVPSPVTNGSPERPSPSAADARPPSPFPHEENDADWVAG